MYTVAQQRQFPKGGGNACVLYMTHGTYLTDQNRQPKEENGFLQNATASIAALGSTLMPWPDDKVLCLVNVNGCIDLFSFNPV